jgi:Recombination endonuclease VII
MLCRICGHERPEDEFYLRKETGRRRRECSPCLKRIAQERYQANREPRKDAVRAWQKANPDKVRANRRKHQHRRHIRDRFGLTVEEWDAMLIAQSGRCAICNDPMEKPCVDHDHETGATRALLCKDCNTGLGHFRDDTERLMAATQYLYAHRATLSP